MMIFFYISFIIFVSYFVILMLYYLCLTLLGLREERRRAQQHESEDYYSLLWSTFTIPVSIIIPAHNEETWILDCVYSALNVNYPEFEVIVVDDESDDNTLKMLTDEMELEVTTNPYHDRFNSGKIKGLYRSKKYQNLTVMSKASGGKKAGAVNAALNLVRYKYVCTIDADTIFEPDALLKVMAHVEKDPEGIVGIGSYCGLVNGFEVEKGKIIRRSFSYNPIVAYQNIEYLRSFIGNRIAWSRYNATPIVSGGFAIWRRDVIFEIGAFAPEYSSEDLEFSFRARRYMAENKKKDYKIIILPYCVGWTCGPDSIKTLIQQRDRWQRVGNETVWKYKDMLFNPKYGKFAFLVMPYFLLYEVLGVFVELASIIVIIAGWLCGLLNVTQFLAFILLIMFSQIVVSLLALYSYSRGERVFDIKYISYLVFLTFFESFFYRWLLLIARLGGMWHYIRGVRTFDQFERIRKR
ncbi:MAG: glycosyltransferase [Candidatus Omnitrophota bacterium]